MKLPGHQRRGKLLAAIALAAVTAVPAATFTSAKAAEERAAAEGGGTLVVCADPNNLPFSNRAREGFENRIVALLAREMHKQVEYVWWAQRRGYVRNTLTEERCDVWPGVASGVDRVATTRPYYRSTYQFVSRATSGLSGLTLDDPRLKSLSIGVQMVGNDAMNTPPAHAMARRGLIDNVRGYMLYGDYQRPNPPAAIIDAVSSGTIDVALVWGPLAGYFAGKSDVPLRLEPVKPESDGRQWPMSYSIAMGVRREDRVLRERIDAILVKDSAQIDTILQRYKVPLAAASPVQQTRN